MAPTHDTAQPMVITPLEYERQALLRAGVDRHCTLACCGVGAAAILRWADQQDQAMRSPVILAGVAGALTNDVIRGRAYIVSAVHAQDGRHFRPSFRPDLCDPEAGVTMTDHAVRTPDDRRALADRTGAVLADMESVALAEIAFDRGWSWAIVRGVSDGLQDVLPPQIDDWVDHDGKTNRGKVVRSLLRRPWLIGTAMRLGRHSSRALEAVAERILHMVQS